MSAESTAVVPAVQTPVEILIPKDIYSIKGKELQSLLNALQIERLPESADIAKKEFKRVHPIIKANIRSFIATGEMLKEIRDHGLWLPQFSDMDVKSFKGYIVQTYESDSRPYQILKATDTRYSLLHVLKVADTDTLWSNEHRLSLIADEVEELVSSAFTKEDFSKALASIKAVKPVADLKEGLKGKEKDSAEALRREDIEERRRAIEKIIEAAVTKTTPIDDRKAYLVKSAKDVARGVKMSVRNTLDALKTPTHEEIELLKKEVAKEIKAIRYLTSVEEKADRAKARKELLDKRYEDREKVKEARKLAREEKATKAKAEKLAKKEKLKEALKAQREAERKAASAAREIGMLRNGKKMDPEVKRLLKKRPEQKAAAKSFAKRQAKATADAKTPATVKA